ncbi:MAG: alpha/beta fold hydrolase [Candidatus Hermodarchaeota archaeon]
MPYIQYKDKKIFYQIKENETEKALIFVHGSGGNSNTWKEQLANLDVNYNLIAIDLPSHDRSDDFSTLSLELYIDVVKNLVKNLKFKDIVLAGHSLGGAIIQSYYLKYPNEVSALILIGSGARLRVSPFILSTLQNDFQEFLENLPIGAFYRRTPKDIVNEYIAETSKIVPEVTYQDFKICDNFDILDKMSLINVPCLIICGKDDKLTPVKYSMYFHEKLRTSELVIIEKASHMVMLEKPEELNHAITIFMENNLKS